MNPVAARQQREKSQPEKTPEARESGRPPVGAEVPAAGVDQRARYARIRGITESLAEPLAVEDYVVQSMPDVSPTKWHLAHVTWFFETFVLMPHLPEYEPVNPAYQYLFNSYYLGAGERHCRDQRGYISRPTVAEVYAYRRHVDEAMDRLLRDGGTDPVEVARVVEIGLHHEQQHQELLLTDIKHVLSVNPLRPAYRADGHPGGSLDSKSVQPSAPLDSKRPQSGTPLDSTYLQPDIDLDSKHPQPGTPLDSTHLQPSSAEAASLAWVHFPEGLVEIGADGDAYTFDNERPRHRHFVEAFDLASRPVTNGEFLAFMEDGGYERGELWLSEGWATAQARGWTEPFYWEKKDGEWWTYTLEGARPLQLDETACHLTYFEADAYARWADARLPSEQEWEVAAQGVTVAGNMAGRGRFHPEVAKSPHQNGQAPALQQMFGDVWEWTRSQYSPYPGYQALPGTLGEYNGKFMSNQFVLRGGSCVTPDDHIRPTYRNFFPADAAWQFSGVRLARDAG